MSRLETTPISHFPHHEAPEPPPITGRRSFLRWLIHGMGLIMAAIIAIPAVAYLIDPRHRARGASQYRDVTRLSALPVGEPREFVLREDVRDAWNLRPDEVVGRVFLVRRNADTANPQVEALSTICPHMGCSVAFTGETGPNQVAFQCPCHGGQFRITGQVLPHNVAPRDMDSLLVQLRPLDDGDKMVQVEYKKFYGNRSEKVEVR